MANVCVIIPTYNESAAIAGLVKAIRSLKLEVVVIDDGSGDNTAQLARDNGAKVLINEVNMGKGACLVKGFNYILERGYDAVVTIDGDGQHLPSEIPDFLRAAEADPGCGIIVGNRMLKRGEMPFVRVLTNKAMSAFISGICRQRIPDTQCGFRFIRRTVLEKVILKTTKYETESEILVGTARCGLRILSVPITSVYSGSKSNINPFVDTLRFIRYVFTNRL
jgi:glycosyltransferase involved in cell wall biosynthesis